MCYQIPGEITKDGEPIFGRTDIDSMDYDFIGSIYPKPHTGTDSISVPEGQWANQLGPFELSFDGTLKVVWNGRA